MLLPAVPIKHLALAAAAALLLMAGLWALLLMAGLWALHAFGDRREAEGRAAVQQQWDAERTRQLQDLVEAERRERHVEQAGQAIVEKEVRHARQEAPAAARAAADLAAARERVRDLADQLAIASAACTAAPAAGGSPPAAGPGLVLAQLYRSADEEAADLGPALDDARARGLRCERIYDELRALHGSTQ